MNKSVTTIKDTDKKCKNVATVDIVKRLYWNPRSFAHSHNLWALKKFCKSRYYQILLSKSITTNKSILTEKQW